MQNDNDTTRRPMSNGTKYGPPEGKTTPQPVAVQSERVTKRNGELEDISIAKIERRIKNLSKGLEVQCLNLAQDVIMGVYDGIHTSEIDRLAAGFAHEKITDHPDYDVLAARIMVSNHHKETMAPFSEVMRALHKAGQIREEFMQVVEENADRLDNVIDYDRDYLFTYFGFRTFETSYGLRIKQKDPVTGVDKPVVYERPQHMWMRVGLALHLDDIEAAIETYDWMSCQYFTHATPTLFNSGKRQQQLASCFLLAMEEDSIEGIYGTLSNVARISKNSGGIGIHISNVRAEGSPIVSAGCESAGIIPMLKPYEATANYVDQGRKRKGAIACFIKGTDIVTINEGVKQIQDVKIGDLVVTHKGNIKSVEQVHRNPLGHRKIYKIIVERNKEIFVTGNHRFWSFHTKKYKDEKTNASWNSVDDLKQLLEFPETKRQSCYISIPEGTGITKLSQGEIDVLDYSDHIEDEYHQIRILDSQKQLILCTMSVSKQGDVYHSQPINRHWKLTEDFANFLGIWLGDGHIRKDNVKGIVRGIGITVDGRNQELIEFIKKVAKTTFGCNITEHVNNRNVSNITINSTLIGTVFQHLFGSYFDGKMLPNMIFSWPKNMVESLLAGIITSDGHIAKQKCNVTIGLSNEKLMTQLYHLCRMNSYAVSFVKGTRSDGMTCDPYSMSIPISEEILNQVRKYYEDDRIQRCGERINTNRNQPKQYLKILDIVETDRTDEFVYTIGVSDDHSYCVEGLIAENCYLEPWHADIEDFLQIKSQTGDESRRMRDLHLALWMCDLFMRRVEADGDWSLMCPFYSPDLQDLYGDAFERRYQEYEEMGAPYVRKTVRARELWTRIVDSQITTGEPYMLYKDSVNKKTNHQNLGTIRSSNLCSEILEYSDSNHTSVCTLASIALKRFVVRHDDGTKSYDFDTLKYVVKMITRNLDRVIDINDYPTIEGKRSNLRERPMGIGVQGLADTYIAMRFPYDSEEAAQLNREIFETIYFGAMEASCELAKEHGPYPSYHMNGGCPVSHGKFQFDMWADDGYDVKLSGRWNWDALKNEVKQHGVRNSLLVALMPTASTSQLLGNAESFEAFTNNIYVRSTLAGSFKVMNQQMVLDLIDAGLWTNEMKNKVIYLGGSIQGIEEIPKEIRDLYKTSFDLSQKVIIDQSADRSCFVDQSQSLNIHMAEPTMASVSSMHMYGNKKGLKTGMYYLRSRPAKRAAQVTVDPTMERQFERQLSTPAAQEEEPAEDEPQVPEGWVCNKEEGCTMCSG